uniref:SET domain-containing protein n=1 Tax=Calcidiscus leptoporus TaxID=127549 RepID=A0A7S0NTJ5_9EUKA
MSSARADAQAALFDMLLRQAEGRPPRVTLQGGRGESGRGLFSTADLDAGEEILRVPSELCLTAHRSGVIGGLIGQTDAMVDAAGDLRDEVGEEAFNQGATWDVRLALAVFEATAGCGGPFWDEYRRLLPLPPFATAAASLPPVLLEELQDPVLQKRGLAKDALLRELYPSLATHSVHPVTSSYAAMDAPLELVPLPLQWTYSLVVSRCFAMADEDTFAFVPFLDMCQHSASPSANFTSSDGDFVLSTLRRMQAGEAVTISYDGDAYDSRRMFELYGFVPAHGNARDAQLLSAAVAEAAAAATTSSAPSDTLRDRSAAAAAAAAATTERSEMDVTALQLLLRAMDAHRDSAHATPARLAAVFDALTEPASSSPEAFYHGVCWQRQEWPTAIDDDLQEALAGQRGEADRDQRVDAVLSYRRACQLRRAIFRSTSSSRRAARSAMAGCH